MKLDLPRQNVKRIEKDIPQQWAHHKNQQTASNRDYKKIFRTASQCEQCQSSIEPRQMDCHNVCRNIREWYKTCWDRCKYWKNTWVHVKLFCIKKW